MFEEMKVGKLDLLNALKNIYVLSALALVFGYFISSALVTQPQVGIIKISGAITTKGTADDVVRMLRYARNTSEIKAVVLEVNSPGGEVTVTEEIYLNILDLRKEKPVVASINQIGASGAYYISVASNYIIAKPSSSIGSIGVVSSLPSPVKLDEDEIITGPFKQTGSSRKDYTYDVQLAQETFLNAVLLQRGKRLQITKEELARAEIYSGIEGKRLGLIDEIGSNTDAIEKAADLARIANYQEVDINENLEIQSFFIHITYVNESILETPSNTVPVNYYLYLEMVK